MSSQERKYFRYRFHLIRVLMVAFLLNSPTQALTLPGGCAKVLMNPSLDAFNDPKFEKNLLDCLQGIITLFRETNWKAVQAAIPKELKALIGKIPNLMEKAGLKTQLVLLSFYLAEKSTELYEEAKHLEIYCRQHQDTFALVKQELAPIIDFINNEILPQFKISDNTGNKAINVKKLSQMLKGYSDALKDLQHNIHEDVKKRTSNTIWSAAYGFAAVSVCGVSVSSLNPGVIIITCGTSLGTAAICYSTYISTGKTLEQLDLLWKETTEFRMAIGRYNAILELVQLRGGL